MFNNNFHLTTLVKSLYTLHKSLTSTFIPYTENPSYMRTNAAKLLAPHLYQSTAVTPRYLELTTALN